MKMVMRLTTIFATLAGTILAGMGLAVAQPYPPTTVLPEVIVQAPPAPPEVAAAAAEPAVSGVSGGSGGSGLAATGGEFTLWMALAVGLLVAGALLVIVSRRRRSSEA